MSGCAIIGMRKTVSFVFDGKGDNLCTARITGILKCWWIGISRPKGDSGIYLRGTPQVQIVETERSRTFSRPMVRADCGTTKRTTRHPLRLCGQSGLGNGIVSAF